MNPTLMTTLLGMYENAQTLSDLGAGVAVDTTTAAKIVVQSTTVEEPDEAASYCIAFRHATAGGGGTPTATPYLLGSYDGGTTWLVLAQGTQQAPGANQYEIIPVVAMAPGELLRMIRESKGYAGVRLVVR